MQKNYGIKFAGLGTALPSRVVKNVDLEKLYETSDEWITKRTGIKERRIISGDEDGLSLSYSAARDALKQAGLNASEIDLIIVSTSTPDNFYPSMACALQGKLGASNAVGYDLSAACSGFVFGIVTGSQFIYNGTFKNILVVGVDVHSRFMDWSERSVSVLFGDGAGAIVLQSAKAAEDELIGYKISSKSDIAGDLVLPNKNSTFDSFEKNSETNTMQMNGKAIFEFGVKVVPDAVKTQLDVVNLKTEDIDYFIPHQANQRIIDSAAKKMGFKENQIISNVAKVGNTSAASIPLAMMDGIKSGKIKSPCKMILVGFGAGLTWGSAVVDWKLQ